MKAAPMKDRRDDPRPIRFTLTTPVATYAIAVPSKHARKGLPGYPLVPIELLEGGSAEIPPIEKETPDV